MLTLIFRNAYFQLSLFTEHCISVYIQLKRMRIMDMIVRCLWMRIIELGSLHRIYWRRNECLYLECVIIAIAEMAFFASPRRF